MSNNEVARKIPFEVKAECFKETVKEYFSRYKNESGAEDCIEVCLIREGYRAVLGAEEEINRQKAEIEKLNCELSQPVLATKELKISHEKAFLIGEERAIAQAIKSEARKEFADKVAQNLGFAFLRKHTCVLDVMENLLKEMESDDNG